MVGRPVVIRRAFFAQAAGGDDVVPDLYSRPQSAGGAGDQEGARAEADQFFQQRRGVSGADGYVRQANPVTVQVADAQVRFQVGFDGPGGIRNRGDHRINEAAHYQRGALGLGIASAATGEFAHVRLRVDHRGRVAVVVQPVGWCPGHQAIRISRSRQAGRGRRER